MRRPTRGISIGGGSRRSRPYLFLGIGVLIIVFVTYEAILRHPRHHHSDGSTPLVDSHTTTTENAKQQPLPHDPSANTIPVPSIMTPRVDADTSSTTSSSSTASRSPLQSLPLSSTTAPRKKAYLLIISNEEFLDGALVLGISLRQHSPMLQEGVADMAIIITEGRVGPTSQKRLRHEGGFDQIYEVPSLAKRAPKAYWKDTFDKIYMFNMTQYDTIVFMDADMICVRSMDELFAKKADGDANSVSAIGFRGGGEGPYFQTGMMVIHPTREKFAEIFERFESGVPPRGNQYNHGMNGRDGVLLRDVFQNNFKILDNKYSRNLNPRWKIPSSVISLHLRGKIKPWFNRELPNEEPELGKKEFGFPYVLWWEIYEGEIHKKSPEYRRALQAQAEEHASEEELLRLPEIAGYGGKHAGPGVTPLTHVWMMRYTTKEYIQLLSEESAKRQNQTLPGLVYRTGAMNQSCDEVCRGNSVAEKPNKKKKKKGKSADDDDDEEEMKCSAEALRFSHGNNCEVLREAFPKCTSCEPGVYWRPHPGSDYPAMDFFKGKWVCKYNLMFDERGRPNCTARYETSQRFCPCVPL